MCFLQLYLKLVNYGLVIIIRLCHWLIIHDDKTVISYFMPGHQMLNFSYNFKAKRYNVNLMNKTQSEPMHFGVFICDYTTFTNFSIKYHLMCKVYTDVGGIK